MDTSLLPSDFKEFLKLLNSKQIEYLLMGSYAVRCFNHAKGDEGAQRKSLLFSFVLLRLLRGKKF